MTHEQLILILGALSEITGAIKMLTVTLLLIAVAYGLVKFLHAIMDIKS